MRLRKNRKKILKDLKAQILKEQRERMREEEGRRKTNKKTPTSKHDFLYPFIPPHKISPISSTIFPQNPKYPKYFNNPMINMPFDNVTITR